MGAPAPVGVRGAAPRGALVGEAPHGAPEGFLFVATKRNPSDSKEKNAFWVGKFGDTGNSGHQTGWYFRFASLRFMPD